MPKIITWRILGTSLQKTSKDDRSDPHRCFRKLAELVPRLLLPLIVKHEEGIRSPTGPELEQLAPPLEAPPRWDKAAARRDGSRFHAPLLRGTKRRRLGHLSIGGDRSLPDRDGNGFGSSWCQRRWHVWWARGHVRASRLPKRDGHLDRRADLGNSLHGDWCRLSPSLWGALREGQLNGEARCGTGCGSRRRLKDFPGSHIGQAMASLAEEERKVTVGTYR
jgi:hypothetical protein